MTAKVISNIERRDINGKRHDNDATTVKLWVESMKCQEKIQYYFIITQKSFQLVLQSGFQSEMLAPEKVVCTDDTDGKNAYNLHLTILMVLNELEEGLPEIGLYAIILTHQVCKLVSMQSRPM